MGIGVKAVGARNLKFTCISGEIKNVWSFISTVLRLHRVQRDKFAFTLPPNRFY